MNVLNKYLLPELVNIIHEYTPVSVDDKYIKRFVKQMFAYITKQTEAIDIKVLVETIDDDEIIMIKFKHSSDGQLYFYEEYHIRVDEGDIMDIYGSLDVIGNIYDKRLKKKYIYNYSYDHPY
jgi:hydroxypyruvate isomerase